MSLWNPGDPEALLISKMELFVTIVNRILKSSILNAAGFSICSDCYHRLRQKCCPGDKKLLTSQLFSNKLILQQASAKGTGTNPSFI